MASRLADLLKGYRSNFRFANRFQVLYDRIFRRHLPLTHYVLKNGLVFICSSRLGDHIAIQECFCEHVYDRFLDRCQFPANRIAYVNIGAHIGAFDLMLAERGLIIEKGLAVELNPQTFAKCVVNLQANGFWSVKAVNAGIGENDRLIRFNPSGLSIGDGIFSQSEAGEAVEVQLLTLATLLERHAGNFPRFDLLKLDCERAEYAILRTSAPGLLRKFRYLIIEFHPPPKGESVETAYSKLKDAGFVPLENRRSDTDFVDLFTRAD